MNFLLLALPTAPWAFRMVRGDINILQIFIDIHICLDIYVDTTLTDLISGILLANGVVVTREKMHISGVGDIFDR